MSSINNNYYQTTQPLLFEQLREKDINIASEQINLLLISDCEIFHAEKDERFQAGLEVSGCITVNVSGARHRA